jgi:tetratricopeptide (TPR) repeat protein
VLGTEFKRVGFLVGGTDMGYGLIGANLLDAADLEADLAHGKVTLFKPDHCKNAGLAYWTKDGLYDVAEMDSSASEGDRRTFVKVTVNGKPMRALLDSGAYATAISRRAAERAGIEVKDADAKAGGTFGVGGKPVRTWIAPVDAFSVGTETIQHSKMVVLDEDLGDSDMMLGVDFFLAHHLYIANSQRKIYLTYNGGRVFSLADAPEDAAKPAAGSAAGAGGPALATAPEYARRGVANLSRGEPKAAIADLDQAIRLAPDQADYYAARAKALAADHQPDAALSDLDKALGLDPKNVDTLLLRATLRIAHKDLAGATADVKAASALAPAGSPQARSIAGLYVSELDQPATALPLLDAWIDTHRNDALLGATLNERCWARGLSNQMLDKALKDCRKAIRRDGEQPDYLDSLGLVQLRLGHDAEAIKAYEQALAQKPKSAWSRYGLGLAKIHNGQTDAGLADLAAAKALDPDIETLAAKHGLK